MIEVFLTIYIIHAAFVIWFLQYFFMDAIMLIYQCTTSAGGILIALMQQVCVEIANEDLVLEKFLLFPKDYLAWYLSPVVYLKEANLLGNLIMRFENIFVILVIGFLAYYIGENVRSYYKFIELTKHLHDIEQECPICLEDLVTPNENAERVRCGHFFHNSCLSKWIMQQEEQTKHLNYSYRCPLCRQTL